MPWLVRSPARKSRTPFPGWVPKRNRHRRKSCLRTLHSSSFAGPKSWRQPASRSIDGRVFLCGSLAALFRAARGQPSCRIGDGNRRLFGPFADGIVSPDPVGVAVDAADAGGDPLLLRRAVAHVLEASVGEGEPLHPMHARNADAAE